ncbi:MAG: M20/M25/M40 family metallo-hydrolase [Candidatus Dormibacteria bacterium]
MQDVFDHIDQNREDYLERLRTLCRQPGIAAQGTGMAETLECATRLCRQVGATTEHLDCGGQPVLWADFGGSGSRTIALYNHYDVQPPEPLELWQSGPFDADVREGRLYARGASDDKGYLVARLCAIDAYRTVRGELPVRVRMVAEGEEEIGSPHLDEFVRRYGDRLRECDAVVWEGSHKDLAGRAEIYLGMKGMIYVEFTAHGPGRDTHSMWGGVLPNPAWKLARLLNLLVDPSGRITIPGFYDDIRDPGPANEALLAALDFDEEKVRAEYGIDGFARGLTGMALKRELFLAPTANIAGFHSGYGGPGSKTILPAQATLKMDFRLVPAQDPERILTSLREHLDANGFSDVSFVVHGRGQGSRTNADDPAVGALLESAAMVGLETVVVPNSPGTGPMYLLCEQLGLPAVSGECVGRETSLIHSPNEHIHLDDYYQAIKHFAAFMDVYSRA